MLVGRRDQESSPVMEPCNGTRRASLGEMEEIHLNRSLKRGGWRSRECLKNFQNLGVGAHKEGFFPQHQAAAENTW